MKQPKKQEEEDWSIDGLEKSVFADILVVLCIFLFIGLAALIGIVIWYLFKYFLI